MKIDNEYTPISFDEALKDPSMSHFHELIHYLEITPNKVIFSKKYELSIQDLTTRKTQALFDENPSMPLKNVLTIIIEYLPDDLAPKLLLKTTQLVVKKWEKLIAKLDVERKISQLV